jgi:hypothetical protein
MGDERCMRTCVDCKGVWISEPGSADAIDARGNRCPDCYRKVFLQSIGLRPDFLTRAFFQ